MNLPCGQTTPIVEVPTVNQYRILLPQACTEDCNGDGLPRQATAHPDRTPRLREMLRPGQTVVVATSDRTRPCPSRRLSLSILNEPNGAGLSPAHVALVIALGLHRPMMGDHDIRHRDRHEPQRAGAPSRSKSNRPIRRNRDRHARGGLCRLHAQKAILVGSLATNEQAQCGDRESVR